MAACGCCLQFLQLLELPSSFPARAPPTLGSAHSVNSETVGMVSRTASPASPGQQEQQGRVQGSTVSMHSEAGSIRGFH